MTRKVRAAIKEKPPVVTTYDVAVASDATPLTVRERGHEVIQPTDLTTFDPEEYVQGVYNGIQDAMGEADLYSVACALDMSLDTLLQVVSHVEGPIRAREFAQKYLQTALPYASYQLGTKTTYAQLRDMRGKKD
jgi:hypothetical protein